MLHMHNVETHCGLLHRTYRGLLLPSSELYIGELHTSMIFHSPKQ
jgi:hypothetical protein